MTSVAAIVASVASLVLGSPGHAGPCDQLEGRAALRIDRDRIGPFPTGATLGELRAMCPDAVATLGFGFETAWAALDLGIGGIGVLAGQNWRAKAIFDDPSPDPTPEWDRAPSHWVLRGCGAQLPRGVSSCGTWSELTAAFGREGDANAEFGPVLVRLDALPGMQLRLSVTDEVVDGVEALHDLSGIPPDARIEEIVIVPAGAE